MKGLMISDRLSGRPYFLYRSTQEDIPLPLIVCHAGNELAPLMEQAAPLLKALPPFALCAALDVSWDRDYTPWPSDCMENRCFSGGADQYLDYVEEQLLPHLKRQYAFSDQLYALGYSLGGLCALYSLTRNSLYSSGASVSGALWYPDFEEYFTARRPAFSVYCSLGRAESRTRHPVMGRCLACTQSLLTHPEDCFEWNNGNHFFEIPQRLVRAMRFLLSADNP